MRLPIRRLLYSGVACSTEKNKRLKKREKKEGEKEEISFRTAGGFANTRKFRNDICAVSLLQWPKKNWALKQRVAMALILRLVICNFCTFKLISLKMTPSSGCDTSREWGGILPPVRPWVARAGAGSPREVWLGYIEHPRGARPNHRLWHCRCCAIHAVFQFPPVFEVKS